MRFRRGMIGALGLILALPPICALAADAPATRPAPQEDRDNSPVDEIVSKLDANDTRLGDFVTFLADQWKDVQIVQVKGPWQDLTLPSLHLRNVTREQVLMLMGNMYPQLFIHPLEENPSLFGGNGNHHGKNVWIFQQVLSAEVPVRTRVSAFGLAQTVDRLALQKMVMAAKPDQDRDVKNDDSQIKIPDKDAEQKAMKDVLSLIQATLDQSAEPDITPTVMLHEPTETVLVKGTSAQISAVTQALQALSQSISENLIGAKLLMYSNENKELRKQLKAAQEIQSKLEAQLKASNEGQHKPGSNE